MIEKVLARVKTLCSPAMGEEGLTALCAAACARLNGLLAEGVTAEDCGEAYILAAAWLVMDWMRLTDGNGDITALTAGGISLRREGGRGGELTRRAMELLGPHLRDAGFVFQGV